LSNEIKPKNYFPIPNSVYFSGLMTYRSKKPTRISLDKLILTREVLNKNQCELLKEIKNTPPVLNVHIADYHFIFDGHNRTYAAYLRGDKTIKTYLVDLNKFFSKNVKRHSSKKKIDLYDISAADLEEAGLL